MITDPKTTVRPTWAQCLVAFLVAAMEAVLRLMEFVTRRYTRSSSSAPPRT